MSRMGEWWMEWREDDDLDLMLAALAHEEELHQRQLEEQNQCQAGLINPQTFQLKTSTSTDSLTAGKPTATTSVASLLLKKL